MACDPAVPLLDIYPRELKTCPHKNAYMNVHSSIIHNGQKQPKCPSANEWINKMWSGNSLAVQWLGLRTLTTEGLRSIPGRGTKIPQAARCGPPPQKKLISKTKCGLSLQWEVIQP